MDDGSTDEYLQGAPSRFMLLRSLLNELNQESDRGAAIVAVSMLEQRLLELPQHLLVEGWHSTELLKGPVSSFANRLNLAMAVGLIAADEYAECTRLRDIRNRFAHKFEFGFSFDDPQVAAACEKLEFYFEDLDDEEILEGEETAEAESTSEPIGPVTPRDSFIKSVAEVYLRWIIREYHTQNRRMQRSSLDETNH